MQSIKVCSLYPTLILSFASLSFSGPFQSFFFYWDNNTRQEGERETRKVGKEGRKRSRKNLKRKRSQVRMKVSRMKGEKRRETFFLWFWSWLLLRFGSYVSLSWCLTKRKVHEVQVPQVQPIPCDPRKRERRVPQWVLVEKRPSLLLLLQPLLRWLQRITEEKPGVE